MSNRSLIYMTVAVVLGIAFLIGINFYTVYFQGDPQNQEYLKYNFVRGIAVEHNDKLYTLNFEQQNALIGLINRSIRVTEFKANAQEKPEVSKIIVYQFNAPDIVITPIAYSGKDLIMKAPQLDADRYLMDVSEGGMHQLLSQTYDH